MLVLHNAERAAVASNPAAFESREKKGLLFAVMIAIGERRDEPDDLLQRCG
jgi:hypothetical protein